MIGEEEVKFRKCRRWWWAQYNGVKGIGMTRTEALSSLLLTLRNEIEIEVIKVKPIKKGGERHGLRAGD